MEILSKLILTKNRQHLCDTMNLAHRKQKLKFRPNTRSCIMMVTSIWVIWISKFQQPQQGHADEGRDVSQQVRFCFCFAVVCLLLCR